MKANDILDIAQLYAEGYSGCIKVKVGAAIVKHGKLVSLGANKSYPDLCTTRGCLRVELYGDNYKSHRLPSDCRAIHSEIDAISSAMVDLNDSVIYVTRYPCEACARAIVSAGISYVVYGRRETISEETQRIFDYGHVNVYHKSDWEAPDNNA